MELSEIIGGPAKPKKGKKLKFGAVQVKRVEW